MGDVVADGDLDLVAIVPFGRVLHWLLSLVFPWFFPPQRARYSDGTPRPLLDYWTWDHFMIPFVLYLYFRSWVTSWLVDLMWEIFEQLLFSAVGWWMGWRMAHGSDWPDTFKPESRVNSLVKDPFTGLAGILLAKLAVVAFDLPPLRSDAPVALTWPDWQSVVQLLIIAVSGMSSGTGFWQLYFFGALEAGVVVLIQLVWNDVAMKTVWVWLGVMAATVFGTSLARFVPRALGPTLQDPFTTLAIPVAGLYIAFGIVAIAK